MRAPYAEDSLDDDSLDDDSLMQAFQRGESEALAVLFDRHAPRLYRALLRITACEALAMDLTQTTFLSVMHGKSRFVAKSRFASWLYTIAMNALRDHMRRAKRELLTQDGPEIDRNLDDPRQPDPGLEKKIQEALQRLPNDQREAVILHQLEGFAFKEIAEIVGTSESAIKVRAHRGYVHLRKLLGDIWLEVAS